MPEIPRTRDVNVIFKGDAYTVLLDPAMLSAGWAGGQGIKWKDDPTKDEFIVTYSDGLYGGFLLWGSNEDSDQFVSFFEQQVTYGYGVLCSGGWIIATRTYEHYTYASRMAGPLVPITYTVGERLRFSLRGLWTNEDEWTLSSDPRGSNDFFVASVVQTPIANARGEFFLTLQTSI